MAHIYQKDNGRWKAEIELKGVRVSKTLPRKADVEAWAKREEAAILAGDSGGFPNRTVAEAFDRYAKEVSSTKRGGDAEVLRLEAFKRDFPVLSAMVFHKVKAPDLAKWRDARLKKVTSGSVRRDVKLLRNVWTVAAREWKWCSASSPWRDLTIPAENPPRTQRIRWQDVKCLVRRLGYRTGKAPTNKREEAAYAFLIALRSAMRTGEIVGTTRETVCLKSGVVRLDEHKTLEVSGVRHVPLTPRAVRLFRVLAGREGPLWTVTSPGIKQLFYKVKGVLDLKHLLFRDSRAEALTLLARRFDPITLARISGHKDLYVLMNTYYRETPEQIAARVREEMTGKPAANSARIIMRA